MDNVVKFPKPKKALPALDLNVDSIKASMPQGATVKAALAWAWLILRLPVFLVLYWLRLPVIFLCNLVSIPMLLAWLFAWYAFPDKTTMVWGFGMVSFLAFVIAWVYDFVLVALSPQEIMRTL